jgi:hypothetical protein
MIVKRRRSGLTPYVSKEMVLMMADYNGWADEREEEREALDQLETTLATAPVPGLRLPVLRGLLLRAAAREILARPA